MPFLDSDSDSDSSSETDFMVPVTPEDLSSISDAKSFAERMQQASDDAQSSGSSRLALDLGQVSRIRSAGLNGLIAVNSNARCDGLRVVLLNVQEGVREVFSLTRLERMFEFEESPVAGNPA